MSITIHEIAKILGVAPSTVSKALNNRPNVNDDLRAKIKQTADRMGYAPYVTARETGMYDNQFKTIAFIYPRLGQHIVEQLQQGTNEILRQEDYFELRYTFDIGNSKINENVRNELLFKKLLSDTKISGIVFISFEISDVILAQFHKRNIPTVLLNNHTDYSKSITINNYKAMYQLVKKLVKLGHKNIGLIIPNEKSEHIWLNRFNGYKQGLSENKLKYNPNYIIHEWTFKINEAGYATKNLITNNPEITAIIYGNDLQAYGGLKALSDMKIKVPDDIAIIGWDDIELNKYVKPSLSSVRQPIEKMGELGIKMLINSIKTKKYKNESIELASEINLRGSCIKDYKDPFLG